MEKSRDAQGRWAPVGDKPLERKTLGVKIDKDLQEAIQKIPVKERGDWIRKVLTEAARSAGLLDSV